MLAQQGYRTAYMHSGTLEYDSDGEFLRRHGFKEVIGESQDYDSPMDGKLVPKTIDWIKQDSSKPFFLALWTMDTHHPYVSPGIRDYHVGDRDLNRYLNGIYATDDMIGRLEQALERMHLADNTLLVVTGDHGEAFREHGQQIHGFSVHEEEVHVPVLIVNPRLFPHQIVNRTMGRQIDLAPTLLAMLGYHEPGEWQGMNLLSGPGPARAYLFATWGDFTLGLIEGNTKYIFDFDRSAGSEVYDLGNDPSEQHDLAQQPGMAPLVQRARIRVEGWLSFQNGYLSRFVPGNPGPVGGGASQGRLEEPSRDATGYRQRPSLRAARYRRRRDADHPESRVTASIAPEPEQAELSYSRSGRGRGRMAAILRTERVRNDQRRRMHVGGGCRANCQRRSPARAAAQSGQAGA